MTHLPPEESDTLLEKADSPVSISKGRSHGSLSHRDLAVKSQTLIGQSLSNLDAKSQADLDKISDNPLFPLNFQELGSILWMLIKAGVPTSTTFLAGFVKGLLCLAFVGKYGTSEELAGASLATSIGNLCLISILFCLNQGFAVMAAHFYGAAKYRDIGVLFQRHLCVLLAVSAPILLTMAFSDVILTAIGTNPEVARCTGIYIRYIIPSMIALYISDFVKAFLMAQNDFFMAGAMQFLLLVIHVFWCLLFVFKFDMPFTGPAIAKSITDVTCAVILLLYVKFKPSIQKSLIPFTRECLQHWFTHLKETAIIGFSVYVGYILFEFSLLLVIYMNDQYVIGAHSIAILISTCFFMLCLGNSLAMQAYLGNAMGEGRKNKAQKIIAVGLFWNGVISLFGMTIMIVLRQQIITLFTDVPETNSVLVGFLYVNCVQYPADTFKDHLAGVMRSIGREREVFKILIYCYVILGINAEWILCLVVKLGYMGIWIGIAIGLYVTSTVFFVKILRTDWDKEVAQIQERMKGEKLLTASKDDL